MNNNSHTTLDVSEHNPLSEPQVRSICNNVRPDRQSKIYIFIIYYRYANIFNFQLALLFSATFKPKVEYLAREVTSDPVRITIGIIGQVSNRLDRIHLQLSTNTRMIYDFFSLIRLTRM